MAKRAEPRPGRSPGASGTAGAIASQKVRNADRLALRHWTRVLMASPWPPDTLDRILRGMCRLLGAHAAAVWQTADDGALQRVASHGLSEGYVQAVVNLAPGEGATAIAAHTGAVVNVSSVSTDSRVTVGPLLEQQGFRAFVSAALFSHQGPMGSLDIYRRTAQAFTDDELDLVTGLADVVGAALENARLREGMASAVAQVAAKEAMLASVVTNAADGIILIDEQSRILVFNPACERLTGWRLEEVVGRRCFEFLRCHRCGGGALCENACPMLPIFNSTSTGVPYGELLVNRRDGGEVWVGASWSVARDGPGRHPTAVMILRDITAAKEIDRMKSAIIGLVSHELRTPLTSIRMFSELLIQHQFEPAEGQEVIRDIAREAQRLGQLIDNILEVARIEGGQVPLHLQPVALGPIVAEAVALLHAQTAIHTFQVEAPEDFTHVRADPDRVRQILDNLLANAIKYSPAGGSVRVHVARKGSEVQVSVSDQGIGIAPDELGYLFEPFGRVSSADVAGVSGTGLGLHIARSLVERQGGRIWAESTSDQGSTFTFTLPLARGAAASLPLSEELA